MARRQRAALVGVLLLSTVIGAGVVRLLTVDASSPGVTERVNVDSAGAQTNGGSNWVSMSADGRYVAFDAGDSNLVSGDTNAAADIFVRDRSTGTTERVSIDSTGAQATGGSSHQPSISADGRYVVFWSFARNLVAGDTNGTIDIFVHDRSSDATERVSVDSSGVQGNHDSFDPSISYDGRYVAFQSRANNLVPGDMIGYEIYIRDRLTGTTERASVDSAGTPGNGQSYYTSISADGRYVAFWSLSSNLVPGDTNGAWDVFVRDRSMGTTERVSVNSAGVEHNYNDFLPPPPGERPSISADGRHVAFQLRADNLVPGDTNAADDVFVRDRTTGTTERVSLGSAGAEGNGSAVAPSISVDGRYVAFISLASNLVSGDTNGYGDVFIRDRSTGDTDRVSVSSAGDEGNIDTISFATSVSADGRYVAFYSFASNLVPGDTNGIDDVFIRDRCPEPNTDGDCFPDLQQTRHLGPTNVNGAFDNCSGDYNADQLNTDGNYIDHSPPYMPNVDDKTWPDSDHAGDACDNDADNDGISYADEASGAACATFVTDPLLRDSDADRFLDSAECALGTDPTAFASKPLVTACGATTDVDGDKLTERVEFCFYGTDPNNSDTDGDKALDGGKDGCEASSFNGDRIVNVADMGMLATAITNPAFRVVSVDVNKDGVWNPADQGLVASFISPSGQCPG